MVWALVIALCVQLLAYLIYKVGNSVVEDYNHFWVMCGIFFIVFTAAAVGMSFLIPTPDRGSVSSIASVLISND